MATSHNAVLGSSIDYVPIKRALLSVSDKTGLIELAQFLASKGVELISTGGTAVAIKNAGLTVKEIDEFTGSPEMLSGRVKTLHPRVHGGILAVRGNESHAADVAAHSIQLIDLVVVNLYPFQSTVASGAEWEKCVENIDIGGPSMIRSSAKNHAYVSVLTSTSQYASFQKEMDANNGAVSLAMRKSLARDAFTLTAEYDTAISQYMKKQLA
jgi:phosphoribosylaminoimidazolecarboxamide formyltransferase/IMP cyclohydrolase